MDVIINGIKRVIANGQGVLVESSENSVLLSWDVVTKVVETSELHKVVKK